jgi:glycosyltransferase involved in cell wall biosynthesis
MGKSKIFIVSPFASLWRFNNGGTPTIYNLIKGLIDAGKEVHLVCPLNGNERVDMEGLRVHHFKMWTGAPWRGVRLLNLMYSKISIFLFVLLAWRKTMNVIKKNKPDIIYGLAGPGAVAAYLVARSKHIPNVTRLYGIFIHRFIHNPFQLLLRFDEVVAFKLPCKYLIITDDGTRGDDAARFFKVPPKRIKFWRNGVDDICDTSFNIEDFKRSIGIPKEKKIILSVSRLVKLKRVERIIEAIPEVAA